MPAPREMEDLDFVDDIESIGVSKIGENNIIECVCRSVCGDLVAAGKCILKVGNGILDRCSTSEYHQASNANTTLDINDRNINSRKLLTTMGRHLQSQC